MMKDEKWSRGIEVLADQDILLGRLARIRWSPSQFREISSAVVG
jgi:hypothetical protein